MPEPTWQQFDALIRVVIRTDVPVTLARLRELVTEADEFDVDVTVPHDDGPEVLTITAGTVDPDSAEPFDD